MAADQAFAIDESALAPYLNGRRFDDVWAEYEDKGFVIFERVMPTAEIQRVRDALAPHLTKPGRNNFEGYKSNRVYALIAKAPEVFSDMVTHPLALAFAERELGTSCLLSALLAINLHPGETVQPWHSDDSQIQVPRPRAAHGVSTFWAIDDTTAENGATEFIPGSHHWEDGRVPQIDLGEDKSDLNEEIFKATMPAGSLMIAKGTIYHRGGANNSEAARLIVTPQYCPGWARQLENMLLATPPEIARALPQRTRELLGYNIHDVFMGYVDGVHPDRTLGIT